MEVANRRLYRFVMVVDCLYENRLSGWGEVSACATGVGIFYKFNLARVGGIFKILVLKKK